MNVPQADPAVPEWGNAFTRFLGRSVLESMGWKILGEIPKLPKFIAIAAPHTSNWDFVIGIATIFALGIHVNWLGKHTLFRPPFGSFFRWLGGIAVDRSARQGVTEQAVALFERSDQMILGLSPEGTRKKVERWKSGFYYIALGARVPILLASFDYARKELTLGPVLHPSGNLDADMQQIRTFYATPIGRHPDQFQLPV